MTRVEKKKFPKPIENDTVLQRRLRGETNLGEFRERPRGLSIGLDGTFRGLVETGVHGPAADQVVHALAGDQSWSYGRSIFIFFLQERETV